MSYRARGGSGYGNQKRGSSKLRVTKSKRKLGRRYKIVNPDCALIEQSLKVKLPNGKTSSVNVFDYNLASAVHQNNPKKWVTVTLDDGSHIQVERLTPVFDDEE